MRTRALQSEIVKELKEMVDKITDEMDQDCCEYFDLAECGILNESGDKIIENFIKNYRSGSLGIVDFDDSSAESLIEKFSKENILKLILKNSATETCDYHYQWNEMFGINFGENEYQIEVECYPNLKTLIDLATDAELKEANIPNRESFFVIGYPADRFILKLNPDTFLESLLALPQSKHTSKLSLTLVHSTPMTGYELLRHRVSNAIKKEQQRAKARLNK